MCNGVAETGYLQIVGKLGKEEVLTFCLKITIRNNKKGTSQLQNRFPCQSVDQKFAETLGDDGTEEPTVVGGPRDHVITSSTLIAMSVMNCCLSI